MGNLFFVLYPKINGHILYENSLTEKSLINTAKLLQRFHRLDTPCPLATKKNILSLNKFLKNTQECKNIIFNNTLGDEIDDLSLHFIDKKTTLMKKAFQKKNSKKKEIIMI